MLNDNDTNKSMSRGLHLVTSPSICRPVISFKVAAGPKCRRQEEGFQWEE